MTIEVKAGAGTYPVYARRGALKRVDTCFNLNRKMLVVTDTGVPSAYVQQVASACKDPVVFSFPQGEGSKQLTTYTSIMETLVAHHFTRQDGVVAVGGGVVGDLAGFAASTYMRGVDFYNIPTTVLSQVDSSIGGKTAVDFMGYKNLIGCFYSPKGVIADPDTLCTLPPRQVANGLAEAVKMALIGDENLFCLFERDDAGDPSVMEQIIVRSLELKKAVVEQDEHEAGLRRVLNFGHTLAHAIESADGMHTYYHGECVAMGMVPMCAPAVRSRLTGVLNKLGLPVDIPFSADVLLDACRHDKKMAGESISAVYVPRIGECTIETLPFAAFEDKIRKVLTR